MSLWPISESEKEKSLEMLCEFERKVRDKIQLETKINDLEGKMQEAMKEASQFGMLLQGSESLESTGVEEFKLKLQGTSALVDQLQIELDSKYKLEKTIEVLKGKFLVEPSIHSNDELVEARKQLLKAFLDMPGGPNSIGIKKMGEIDIEPFKKTLEKKLVQEVEMKAAKMCSYWQERVRNPHWFPFKVINGDDSVPKVRVLPNCLRSDWDDSVPKVVIDEKDRSLIALKEWGAEIYEAVTNALKELNEYNPSGRFTVSELWNFKENRKAKTGEAIAYMVNQLNAFKRKRARGST